MSASRIWICIAAITLVAAISTGHKGGEVVKPAPALSCTLKKPGDRCVFQ
jgi:hypothetical protein